MADRAAHMLAHHLAGAAAAAVILAAAPAMSATVGTWTGPGDRACHGRCSQGWAISQLPADRQAQVREAMQCAPMHIEVRDGDRCSLMTYFDGEPIADRRGVIAVLDQPEPGEGWYLPDGSFFMLIFGCTNYAHCQRGAAVALLATEIGAGGAFFPPQTASGAPPASIPALFVGGSTGGVRRSQTPSRAASPTNPAPSPVPLPAAAWLLASALAGLWGFSKWRRG